jgi:FkbM family methyltransferase
MINQVIKKISESSKKCEDSDFLPNVLGAAHYRDVMTGSMPVVLFGAGSAGSHLAHACRVHGVPVACFCDNNRRLIGSNFAGLPVISPEELTENHPESLVVISASEPFAQQIKNQLMLLGFPSDKVCTPPRDPLLYYTVVASLYWSTENLQDRASQIEEVYDLLSDEKSKELFVHRMALLTGGFDYVSFQRFVRFFADLVSPRDSDLFSMPQYDENHFYFDSSLLPLQQNEVFANVGALVGECAIKFTDSCMAKGLHYKEIINFEPDPSNFLLLSMNMNDMADVRCFPYGLWSHSARLRFSNPYPACSGTPGSLDDDGNLEVDVVSLDELLPDAGISLIKMDVEGAEIEALRGAARTIVRNKPKLAISVYHKRDDILEIPLLINRLNSGYRFYLRHHSTTFGETVLFATP